MKLFFTILILSVLSSICVQNGIAQKYTIKGKITDDKKENLIGASIVLAEINLGTISDAEGNFIISNVPKGEYEIGASYIGANAQTKTIDVRNSDLPCSRNDSRGA